MKPINKILNKSNDTLGALTQQALMNQYYTKILQKYLNKPLDSDTLVSSYKDGVLILSTSNNEKLTLLKYSIPDLIVNLRKNSSFIGLINIKITINKFSSHNIKKNDNTIKKINFLTQNAAKELQNLAASIKYEKLNNALLKLSKRIKRKDLF